MNQGYDEFKPISLSKVQSKTRKSGGNWPRKDNCSGSNLRGCRMDWLDGAKKNVNG